MAEKSNGNALYKNEKFNRLVIPELEKLNQINHQT